MITRSMKRRFRKILLASTLALLEGFTAVGSGPRPVFGQGDVLADGTPIEASRVMGEATRQEHLYGQDFDSAKLRDAIKGYTRLVRERPNSFEAYQAAERLKALRIPVPEPDTSYSIVEQNKSLDVFARQQFIDNNLVPLTRRLVQQGLSLEDAKSKMLANAVERLSQLRRPGICVMPGCTNPVPAHKLCPAHITEITTYVENVAKQIKATDQQVEQYIATIRQVNTVEAYGTLANYVGTVDITDDLRSRADRIIIDGKASLERSDTAKLHLKFKLPTGKDADRLAKKYAEVVARQRANIDQTYSNYYIDGQQYPVDRDRLKREYTDALERLSIRDQNSSSKFRKCPVPWCTATTNWGRGSSASGAVCQAHLDEINAIIDERAAYYKARSIKTTVSAPTIDVSFRILYCNGFALSKDLCTGQGSTVQQAIDNAMAGIKDVDGDDLEPASNITIDFKVSGSNNGAIIELSGDATSKTLYKAVEEATTKARQLNSHARKRYNQESLNWLLANWGTKKITPPPKVKAVANDEVTVSTPILQEPDTAQPLTVVASDVRALSKRVFALCKELSDLGAINGLKFNTRFAEVQAELRTLNGTLVTWPATVTRISDDSDYEPGVHVKTVIPWAPGGCGLIGFYVHFVPADVHGDEYLSYGVHISMRYAASLKVGDIIRIHGVIDKSLLEAPNNYSHKLQGFGYNISLTESHAVEPATITAATVKADSEVDKLKAIGEIRAKLQAISVQSPRWPGDLLDQESNALINFVDPSNWRSMYIHTLYGSMNQLQQSQDKDL